MAEISDNDAAGTAGASFHELLGEAQWLSVATQYILKRSRLKALSPNRRSEPTHPARHMVVNKLRLPRQKGSSVPGLPRQA